MHVGLFQIMSKHQAASIKNPGGVYAKYIPPQLHLKLKGPNRKFRPDLLNV